MRCFLSRLLVTTLCISILQIIQAVPSRATDEVKLGVIGLQYNSSNDALTKQQYLPRENSLSLSVNGKNISEIDSDGDINCFVAEGSIYCWGGPAYYGQFTENSTQLASPTEITKPVLFGEKNFTRVSVGAQTICATANFQAYCWGNGGLGQIGNGASQSVGEPTPVSTLGVLSGKSVTDISVGNSHACAVADGKAYCWGDNSYGQLGDGTTKSSNSPVAVLNTGVLEGKSISAISAGSYHTCALANGAVYCWGYNYYGQLGAGTSSMSNSPLAVLTSGDLGGKTVTEISAGNFYTCAVANGAAYCWGSNNYGQLGNGTKILSSSPVAVSTSGVLGARKITGISANANHTCAVANSSIFCWGYNEYGQLGNRTQTDSLIPVAVFTTNALNNKAISQVSTGSNHSCAVANYESFCWGLNRSYQLGDTTNIDSTTAVKVLTSSPAASAIGLHSLANIDKMTLRFVANNQPYSQVVDTDSKLNPKKLPNAEPLGVLSGKVVSKAVYGSGFTCYLVEARVYCSGQQNSTGQLGNGTQAVSTNPIEIDMSGALKGLTITDISAGAAHVCAIASGRVFCWGSNSNGQLGVGDARDISNGFKTTAALSPVAVDTTGALKKEMVVQHLTTSQYATCVVASGQPFCWGAFVPGFHASGNSSGLPMALTEFGEMSGKKVASLALPLQVSNFDSPYTTCAVTTDGEGYCWGNSTYNGGKSRVTTPVKLDTTEIGARKITQIEVGINNGCALALGQLYCWGMNSFGQLGTGDTVNSSRPKLVSQAGILKNQEVLSMRLTTFQTYFAFRPASMTLLQQRKVVEDAELKAIADARAAAELELLEATNQAKRDTENATRERLIYDNSAIVPGGSNRAASFALAGVTNERVDGALKLHSLDISPTFGGRTATSIQVGSAFSCAMAGGTPYCWGSNYLGQLGNGTLTSSAVPTAVALPEKLKGKSISSLSISSSTACVIVQGEGYCWGDNSTGQLGVASVSYSMVPIAVDTSGVLKNLKLTAIEVGQTHTCAIANSKVFCWGNNASSQLGNASAKKEIIYTPIEVSTDGILKDKAILRIAVGANHTCASTINELFCWGSDNYGQLGSGSYGQIKEMKDLKPLQFSTTSVKEITDIEADFGSTCAIADSLLYCWGLNTSGRFVQTNEITRIIKPYKIEMVGLLLGREMQEVGIGSDYLCVLASSAPLCWGANDSGQLGNGTVMAATTPTKVDSAIVKAGRTLALSVSNNTSCAIASGRVYCWGASFQGEGGRLSPTTSSIPLPVGVDSSEIEFKSILGLKGIENSQSFTFVAEGKPYIFTPRVDKNLNPVTFPISPSVLGMIKDREFSKFDSESEFQCYLVENEMYCKGDNSLGQLGNNSTQYSDAPVKVDTSGVLNGKKISDFAVGSSHACVLADGEVFCWGNNASGQLGVSDEKDAFGEFKVKFQRQPVPINLLGVLNGKKITAIEATSQSTCVVATGEIFCWGVLHSSFSDPKSAKQDTSGVPVALQRKGDLVGKQVTKIVLPPQLYSWGLLCAIADDRAYCWGSNRSTGSLNKDSTAPRLVGDKAISSRPVSDLAISNNHACLISMGEVFCWGENSSGQLGIGNVISQAMPVIIEGGALLKNREVFAIALTSNSTLIVHRELTEDKAKLFLELKTKIDKQVAEEERLQALALAEAKAKAEAEAKAKADLARKIELATAQSNLLQSIRNLSQNTLALSIKCEVAIRNLTALQRVAIARTSISTSCVKYSEELSTVSKDLDSINIENVSESNYSSKVMEIKSVGNQINNLEEKVFTYFDEVFRIGIDFDNLIALEEQFAKSAVKDYRAWLAVEDRVQRLPSVTKKSIIDRKNYRNALAKLIIIESAQSSFEEYRKSLSSIVSTKELSLASTQLAIIIAKLDKAESLFLDIAAIEKLIPAFVCTKGSSVTPLPKNGKCLVGAKKTSTK